MTWVNLLHDVRRIGVSSCRPMDIYEPTGWRIAHRSSRSPSVGFLYHLPPVGKPIVALENRAKYPSGEAKPRTLEVETPDKLTTHVLS